MKSVGREIERYGKLRARLVDELKHVVEVRDARRLAPVLADIVSRSGDVARAVKSDQSAERSEMRRQAEAARRIERAAGRLIATLRDTTRAAGAARQRGFLPYSAHHVMADLLPQGRARSSDAPSSFHKAKESAVEVHRRATHWRKLAHAASLGKRGRSKGVREWVAQSVAEKMADAGLRPTKHSDGVFARVLAIVYDAAGIPAPADLYRDTRTAVDALKKAAEYYK